MKGGRLFGCPLLEYNMSTLLRQVMHDSPFEYSIVPFLMPMDVTRMVSTSKSNQSVIHTKGQPHRRLCVSCMQFHSTAELGFQCSRCSDVTIHCPVCQGPFAVQIKSLKNHQSRIRCPSCCFGPLRIPEYIAGIPKMDEGVPLERALLKSTFATDDCPFPTWCSGSPSWRGERASKIGKALLTRSQGKGIVVLDIRHGIGLDDEKGLLPICKGVVHSVALQRLTISALHGLKSCGVAVMCKSLQNRMLPPLLCLSLTLNHDQISDLGRDKELALGQLLAQHVISGSRAVREVVISDITGACAEGMLRGLITLSSSSSSPSSLRALCLVRMRDFTPDRLRELSVWLSSTDASHLLAFAMSRLHTNTDEGTCTKEATEKVFIKDLVPVLSHHPSLRWLGPIQCCDLIHSDAGVVALCKLLESNSRLQTVRLSQLDGDENPFPSLNICTDLNARKILQVLFPAHGNQSLTHVCLDSLIDSDKAEMWRTVICNYFLDIKDHLAVTPPLSQLVDVDISACWLGSKSVAHIISACSSLKKITATNNNIQGGVDSALKITSHQTGFGVHSMHATKVTDTWNASYEYIRQNVEVEHPSIGVLAIALIKHPSLAQVGFTSNDIGLVGLKQLTVIALFNPRLINIDIDDSMFESERDGEEYEEENEDLFEENIHNWVEKLNSVLNKNADILEVAICGSAAHKQHLGEKFMANHWKQLQTPMPVGFMRDMKVWDYIG